MQHVHCTIFRGARCRLDRRNSAEIGWRWRAALDIGHTLHQRLAHLSACEFARLSAQVGPEIASEWADFGASTRQFDWFFSSAAACRGSWSSARNTRKRPRIQAYLHCPTFVCRYAGKCRRLRRPAYNSRPSLSVRVPLFLLKRAVSYRHKLWGLPSQRRFVTSMLNEVLFEAAFLIESFDAQSKPRDTLSASKSALDVFWRSCFIGGA